MNKEKKLIVCDLDGTLLNNKSEISQFTIETIKKIKDNGHIFCISTGRPLRSAIKFHKQLGLNTIISTLNGGVLANPIDKNFNNIYFSFNKDVLIDIIRNEEVIQHINFMVVENINCTYFFSKNKNIKINEKLLNRFHVDKKSLIHIYDINDLDVDDPFLNPISILISLKKEEIDSVSFAIKSLLDIFVVRLWQDNNDDSIIELNTLFSTKGTALKYLSCYYGVSLKNIYAFGDGENDIEMIRILNNGYAMKNAISSLKLISYKITKYNNDEDGVAKELLKILNI